MMSNSEIIVELSEIVQVCPPFQDLAVTSYMRARAPAALLLANCASAAIHKEKPVLHEPSSSTLDPKL